MQVTGGGGSQGPDKIQNTTGLTAYFKAEVGKQGLTKPAAVLNAIKAVFSTIKFALSSEAGRKEMVNSQTQGQVQHHPQEGANAAANKSPQGAAHNPDGRGAKVDLEEAVAPKPPISHQKTENAGPAQAASAVPPKEVDPRLDGLKEKLSQLPRTVDDIKLTDLKELLNLITKSTSGDRIRFLEGEVDKMIKTNNSIKEIYGEMDQMIKESANHISTRDEALSKATAILRNDTLPDEEVNKARKDYRALRTDMAESLRVQSSEISRCKREIEPLKTQLTRLNISMNSELQNERVAYVQDRLQNRLGGEAVDLNSVKNALPKQAAGWFEAQVREMISCTPERLDELNAVLKSELTKKQAQ